MNHWEGATRSVCGSFQAYPQWSDTRYNGMV